MALVKRKWRYTVMLIITENKPLINPKRRGHWRIPLYQDNDLGKVRQQFNVAWSLLKDKQGPWDFVSIAMRRYGRVIFSLVVNGPQGDDYHKGLFNQEEIDHADG